MAKTEEETLTKESAAKFLGISVRKLETLITKNLISRERVPGKKGRGYEVRFKKLELERVKREVIEGTTTAPAQALMQRPAASLPAMSAANNESIARNIIESGDMQLQVRNAAQVILAPMVESIMEAVERGRIDRPLPVKMAAKRAMLSEGFLRAQIKDGKCKAVKIAGLRGMRIFETELRRLLVDLREGKG